MSDKPHYRIPEKRHRTETEVARSRFIATVDFAPTVAAARAILASIRAEMPEADHHVYAYRVGYGGSVIEGMSDDGEPGGTSGPPVLAILRGTDIGDTIVVITRYFGGTKLGTGGLVRAYSEAAHTALNSLPTVEKVEWRFVSLEVPYNLYQPVRTLISRHHGVIEEETFEAVVTLLAKFMEDYIERLRADVRDLSGGKIAVIDIAEA
jgi:uncharacterized YigZ family protein